MADNETDGVDLQAMRADMARMRDTIQALQARMPPPEPEPLAPGAKLEFPRIVYKAGQLKGQIDHLGNVTKRCVDALALEAALADGWALEPLPVVAVVADEQKAEPAGDVRPKGGRR